MNTIERNLRQELLDLAKRYQAEMGIIGAQRHAQARIRAVLVRNLEDQIFGNDDPTINALAELLIFESVVAK